MADTSGPTGLALRLYLAATGVLALRAWKHLEKRRNRGKEHPERWREKAADRMADRPEGPLVWMHAVGLGEVLALRGLIEAMVAERPGLHVLVTSSARASGEVFDRNRPPNTIHQFLPLDVPSFIGRFLDHWRPDLSVWAEQDLWPGFVVETARRGIPLAMINARMGDRAHRSRARVGRLYGDLYRRFAFLAAQDARSAEHLRALAPGISVAALGSLKAACAPLADAPDRAEIARELRGRAVWCAASTHAEDEAVALAAVALRRGTLPHSLLILAPRSPDRREAILDACQERGLSTALRSRGERPGAQTDVWLADTFGEMGIWYRLSPMSMIGGSFGPVEGHNPWEAVRLGSVVLHGPRTANFAADYAALSAADACRPVQSAEDLVQALAMPDPASMAARASAVQADAATGLDEIRDRLLSLLPA